MFQAPSLITQIGTLSDNTIKITINCQELSPEEMAEVFRQKGKIGWFLFKENKFQEKDLPLEEAKDDTEISQSKRLLKVLFVYWKKRYDEGKIKKDFNEFKREWYENKIQQVKDNIDI